MTQAWIQLRHMYSSLYKGESLLEARTSRFFRYGLALAAGLVRFQDRGAVYLRRPWDIVRFLAEPENPVLVSFPRTGSHWLRILLETYSGRPLLPRTFIHVKGRDYLLYHTHDDELKLMRKNVVYLYRNPVDTLFSELTYRDVDLGNPRAVKQHCLRYGGHLRKWLLEVGPRIRMTPVRFEGLRQNPRTEFEKVCRHLGLEFDAEEFERVLVQCSRDRIRDHTSHDWRVVRVEDDYEERRRCFAKVHASLIYETIVGCHPDLKDFLVLP